jgi:hypothetical protein
MKCKKLDGTTVNVTKILFYANCKSSNPLCNASESAYVPAITICYQRLF